MSLRERVIDNLKYRRQKVLNGGINCIPSPFTRFRSRFPGIEQGVYYLVSGATKSSKTQITTYLFLINTVIYYYKNPDKLIPKIFYFPLEETPEAITLRFMSFLLFHLSKGKIRISSKNLKSTDERYPIPEEVLEFMETPEFKNIMEVYEKVVTFYDDRNCTGVFKVMESYAKEHGTIYKKPITIKETDEFGITQEVKKEIFDHYESNDPNEYVMVIVDHVSLLSPERGQDLRGAINKLSEYMILLRNRYKYIPVLVQQQSTETTSLEAFKTNKIRPTKEGLADSKSTGNDCTVMFGITNPHKHELTEYLGYDITKWKSNIRFLEVVLNREGESLNLCPLYFDGAVNNFQELPLPTDNVSINNILAYVYKLRNNEFNFTSNPTFLMISVIYQKIKFNNFVTNFKQWLTRLLS